MIDCEHYVSITLLPPPPAVLYINIFFCNMYGNDVFLYFPHSSQSLLIHLAGWLERIRVNFVYTSRQCANNFHVIIRGKKVYQNYAEKAKFYSFLKHSCQILERLNKVLQFDLDLFNQIHPSHQNESSD